VTIKGAVQAHDTDAPGSENTLVVTTTGTAMAAQIKEINVITGGTGQFSGAQGSFIMERLASGVTFMTFGSFQGTITPPSATK